MSIQQQFDAASVITKLSSAETIKLLCLAYDQDNIFAFSRLVDNTCFSKMSESQMTKLNKMLYEMACHNDLEFAKQLLKIPGIDINFQCEITRFTALVSAISNNFGKFVDLLLANPNLDVSKICDPKSAEISAVDALYVARSRSTRTKIRSHKSFNLATHQTLIVLRKLYEIKHQREVTRHVRRQNYQMARQNTLRPLYEALRLSLPAQPSVH